MADDFQDALGPCLICPGRGRYTRQPGVVYGTEKKVTQPGPVAPSDGGQRQIMEWQWAQLAMFAYYYQWFKAQHGSSGFVLAEAEFVGLLTGLLEIDTLFETMGNEFRRDHARGGTLRPDIIGVHVGPRPYGEYGVLVELLEVTTYGQASKTWKEDVLYKLKKLDGIVRAKEFQIRNLWSAGSLGFMVGPSTWKPQHVHQRVVPLPVRTTPTGRAIEWICFQPTFDANDGKGQDGLLLYEVHSMNIEEFRAKKFEVVLRRIAEQEERRRQQERVAYGETLTPWLPAYLKQNGLDRDEMQALAILAGVGALALFAYVALPVIAGMTVVEGAGAAGAAGAGAIRVISAAALNRLALGLAGTMQTAMQWMTAAGSPIATPAFAR